MMTTNKITERELKNKEIVRKLATEGIVLLENNGVLPLAEEINKIALFGRGARRTIKGGTGSGDVNVRDYVTIEQGLKNAGYSIATETWIDRFDTFLKDAECNYDAGIRKIAEEGQPQKALLHMMENPFKEPQYHPLTKEELEKMSAKVAIYVLSRNSGEGADRRLAAGDYYLTDTEKADLKLIAEHYEHTILLLNVGGVIDLKEITKISGIDAIVYISQGGSSFGDAVADVLKGKVTPSGKLTTTWAKNYEDYPNAVEFGDLDGDEHDAYYKEGIYVGYRYFNTTDIQPLYCFGYGKSYTEFSINTENVFIENEKVVLKVCVKNKGLKYSGKEVVQVYVSAPAGKLDKPYQELKAFAKTNELIPGETETLSVEFVLQNLASYDTGRAAYVLEAGEYVIRVGSSNEHTEAVAVLELPCEVVTEQCRNFFAKADLEEMSGLKSKKREGFRDSITRIIVQPEKISKKAHSYTEKHLKLEKSDTTAPLTLEHVKSGTSTLKELVSQLDVRELISLCVGGARMSMADFSFIGNAGDTVPGAAGDTTAILKDSKKIPSLSMADGPAGIRINPKYYLKDGRLLKNPAEDPIFGKILPKAAMQVDLTGATTCYQYCTALPIATMLAQSWNMDVLKEAGEVVRNEMEAFDICLWLAPGMNIQKNPLGGRNFEYYSEDPYLSGACAAATIEGVQADGKRAAAIKHMAVNNQETNRNYNNSHVSERAMREIYLKGYEICVKKAHPYSVMSALNLINGIHGANHKGMLTNILRDEWGFEGFVMTDWGNTSDFGVDVSTKKYACASSAECIKAGNDLIMPGSQGDVERLTAAVEAGELDMADLQWCAGNILKVVLALKSKGGNNENYETNKIRRN